MTQPIPGEPIAFEYDGSRYEMVFDMKAVAFFEREAEVSLLSALTDLEESEARGAPPKISLVAFLMQAGLRRHHPEVDADRAGRMAMTPEVQRALGLAVQASLPDAEEGEGNVPSPAKKRRASTGTKSLKVRSKPGSRSQNSGSRRRG